MSLNKDSEYESTKTNSAKCLKKRIVISWTIYCLDWLICKSFAEPNLSVLLALPCRNHITVSSTALISLVQIIKCVGFLQISFTFCSAAFGCSLLWSLFLPLSQLWPICEKEKKKNLHYGQIKAHSNICHLEILLMCLSKNSQKTSTNFRRISSTHPSIHLGHFSCLKHDIFKLCHPPYSATAASK